MPFLGRGLGSGKRGGIYTVIPPTGNVSTVFSTITPSASTVVSGASITLTLQLKDANNVNLSSAAGATIVPTKSGGTATGTLSSVTDNGNGTVSWTYTGVLKGTAQTLGCTINGVALSSTLPTCTVTVGAIDRTVSTLTLESSTAVPGGSNVVARLQSKDVAGNNLTTGGSTVVISHSGGTSVISISSVTDVGDGTYTANITPTTAGTATTMSATIGGLAVTTSMPTFTVASSSLFQSDWGFGTGTSELIIRDNNKWPQVDVGSPVQTLSVVAAPTGFPAGMTNVLRVIAAIGGTTFILSADNKWAAIAVGESLAFRYYLQVAIADAQGDQTSHINACHHVQAGGGALSDIWAWNFAPKNDGTFRFEGHTYGNPTPNAHDGWLLVSSGPGYLNKANTGNACYRIEWKVTKTATNVYTLEVRIYDKNDLLLYNKDGVGASIGAIYQAGTGVAMSTAGVGLSMSDDGLRNFKIGSNNGGLTTDSNSFFYFGGVLVKKGDWCGPYDPVTG